MIKTEKMDIIYEDNHLLVVNKPAGMLVQGDRTGDISLLEVSKKYIKQKYNKPGKVFLGLVHRLDRPVSGVLVFARTSKAAARLSEQIRSKKIEKQYSALISGRIEDNGNYVDYISRKNYKSYIDKKNGKYAELNFKRIGYNAGISLIVVNLITGRHHQIRIQFASRGYPILGDFRYGSTISFHERTLALHATSITLEHPTHKNKYTFKADFGTSWSKYLQRM